MVLVLHGKRRLTKWIQLTCYHMLNRIVAGSSLFKGCRCRCILFHASECTFVDTLNKLGLVRHFGVLVQNLVTGEEILTASLLMQLLSNNFGRCGGSRVALRLRVIGLSVVKRSIEGICNFVPLVLKPTEGVAACERCLSWPLVDVLVQLNRVFAFSVARADLFVSVARVVCQVRVHGLVLPTTNQ